MNYIKHLESKIYNYSLKYHFEDVSLSEQKILSEFEKPNSFNNETLTNLVYMQAATLEEMYNNESSFFKEFFKVSERIIVLIVDDDIAFSKKKFLQISKNKF